MASEEAKMGVGRSGRRERYVQKTRAEIESLSERGVVMCGNAFSSVLLVKGQPGEGEGTGESLLAGADGKALRAALQKLGYAPEDWAGLATWNASGNPLDPLLLREAVAALDPATMVVLDHPAVWAVREAYADDLSAIENLEEAMVADGVLVQVAGMRAMSLGGFADALGSSSEKQLMWRRLKQLPPLGEPY
jgi:hypothetical protein